MWPSYSSTTAAGSLIVFSDDGTFEDAVAADDEEEDDSITYRRWRRGVCLMQARSPVAREKEADAQKATWLGFFFRK